MDLRSPPFRSAPPLKRLREAVIEGTQDELEAQVNQVEESQAQGILYGLSGPDLVRYRRELRKIESFTSAGANRESRKGEAGVTLAIAMFAGALLSGLHLAPMILTCLVAGYLGYRFLNLRMEADEILSVVPRLTKCVDAAASEMNRRAREGDEEPLEEPDAADGEPSTGLRVDASGSPSSDGLPPQEAGFSLTAKDGAKRP